MSDEIAFQNGFLCGIATKGLTRTGKMYEPLVWNDEGLYDYFYLDFKNPMEAFSVGMLTESIIVHDSEQLPITGFEKMSASIYKLYCNISDKVSGITVLNKATSLLSFSSGAQLPPFSVHTFIAGILSYKRLKYIMEGADFPFRLTGTEDVSFGASTFNSAQNITDNCTCILSSVVTNEVVTIESY